MVRKFIKKHATLKNYNTAYDVGKKALQIALMTKNLLNVEKKKFPIQQTAVAINTTGLVTSLCNIAQGDSSVTRTGDSILAKSITMRLTLSQHASATITFIRFMLVMDTQQVSDTLPTLADILESIDVTGLLNDQSLGRYRILQDKTYTLTSNGKQGIFVKDYIKLGGDKGQHIRYNGSLSSDVQKSGLYWIQLSNEATNTPTITSFMRLNYIDN